MVIHLLVALWQAGSKGQDRCIGRMEGCSIRFIRKTCCWRVGRLSRGCLSRKLLFIVIIVISRTIMIIMTIIILITITILLMI